MRLEVRLVVGRIGERLAPVRRMLLQTDQIVARFLARVELEADDGVAVEGLGEASQGVGTAAVLTALDAGDHRLGGVHPLGQFLLGQSELGATHDHHAGDLLERTDLILCLPVFGASGAPLVDVLLDAASDGAVVLGHGCHL